MASSDDDSETLAESISNYHFVDEHEGPISFYELPIQWSDGESPKGNDKQIFLHGTTDNGLQKFYKQVTAWKLNLSNEKPEVSVLTKENNWIKLEKPRKIFEVVIRTILITIHCIHYLKKNPEATGKSLWDNLAKVFSVYEVRPSENDLVNHMPLISEAVEREESLKTCKVLLAFLEEKPKKRKAVDEALQPTPMSGFIVADTDDIIDDVEEDGSDDEGDMYDSVCAFCDNGGDILCCDGKCMRSFHATRKAGAESDCRSLRMTEDEVNATKEFLCSNCQHQKHQCFACGRLGSSDKAAGAEVFPCVSATCGHFYHPKCVAKRLHRDDEVAAEELQKKIFAGESFICPVHKCSVCNLGENKEDHELQFAVCRRCPKSFHRKCLPRKIVFDNSVDESIVVRAWDGLLPNRILIYCLKHEIDEQLGTPVRNHIKFPHVEEKKKSLSSMQPLDTKKGMLKRKSLDASVSPRESTGREAYKQLDRPSSTVKEGSSSKRAKMAPSSDPPKKMLVKDASKKSFRNRSMSVLSKGDKYSSRDENKITLGDMLYDSWTNKSSENVKAKKQDMEDSDREQDESVRTATKKLTSSSYQLDADSERSLLDLMKECASSITMEQVKEKHKAPSTHAYSSKHVIEKTITQGKLDGAIEALRTALQKIEAGGSIEEAKAVCGPEVIHQLVRWKNKLKVYLAPFLHGMRYTSYGRHFTMVDKLEEIVEKLHWYVQSGDTIVDFCCGANDFSWLMKKKLEATGKKCFYKNYDILTAKNDFNFEQRDWMDVQIKELPSGSELIMGLNPPFGVNAALANKFIDKALKFKPKLLILIVPQETERLDKKKTPYDLVWEDDELLSGKSFYLPGSIDENDKQMAQWNLEAPPLYLWSRRDWTGKHKSIAEKQGHLSRLVDRPDAYVLDHPVEDNYGNGDTPLLILDRPRNDHPIDQPEMHGKHPAINEGYRENSPYSNGSREGHEKAQSSKELNKRQDRENQRGTTEPSPEDRRSIGRTTHYDNHHQSSKELNKRQDRENQRGTTEPSPEDRRSIGRTTHYDNHPQSSKELNKRQDRENQRGTTEPSPEDRRSIGRTTHYDNHPSNEDMGSMHPLEAQLPYSHEIPMDTEERGYVNFPLASHAQEIPPVDKEIDGYLDFPPIPGSGLLYDTGYEYHALRASVNDVSPRRYINRDQNFTGGIRGVDSLGYNRPYMSQRDEREQSRDDLRARIQQYGGLHDPMPQRSNYIANYDPGFGHTMLPQQTYNNRPPAIEPSYNSRVSTSTMQRYAPQLDELNHTRSREPPSGNRNDMYNHRDMLPHLGFAPGPHHGFPHHSSSGWLNE